MFWKYFLYDIEKRFRDMEIRRWINEHPKQTAYIAAVPILLLLIIIVVFLIPNNQPEKSNLKYVWFYDLNTNKLFKADADARSPIKASSGSLPDGSLAGVRAYVFTTVKEPNESEIIIAYLEKFSPDAEVFSKSENQNDNPEELICRWAKGRFIKRVQDANWFAADNRAAIDIIHLKHLPRETMYKLRPYPAQ
jgi:hypothetical protein